MKTRHALLVFLLVICLVPSALGAADAVSSGDTAVVADIPAKATVVTNASDDLLAADIPVKYGDDEFRKRILERTGGKRSPVGLVLSGGSARAFAHIGVLKYLEEQGIVPDFIVSNSMGSIVGLLYAAGMSPDQIMQLMAGTSLQSLFDITFPMEGGILNPSRFTAKIASILGPDLKLEDLKIPIIVVSEDLVTERQIQICEGNFYDVLQAAYALPVYFPPVDYRGHLLIDGGITNIVPVDLAYTYADSVIVSTTFYDVDTLNLRNPLTVLNVSMDVGKRRRGVEELKKSLDNVIWIRCNVEDFSFMDFSSVKEIAEKGYTSAQSDHDALASLPSTLPVSSLADVRGEFQGKIDKEMQRYMLYSHTPQLATGYILGIGTESWRTDSDDTSYLKDDNSIGLEYTLRSGDLDFSLNGGMGFNSYINKAFGVYPAINARLSYYFLDHLKASVETDAVWDHGMFDPAFRIGENLEGKMFLFDNCLDLRFLQTFETVFHDSDSGTTLEFWPSGTFLFSAAASGTYRQKEASKWTITDASAELAYQIIGPYRAGRQFLSPKLSFGIQNTKTDIFLNLNTTMRFALDGNGNVPYFLSDGFRTNNADIRSQGHGDPVSVSNTADYLVAASLDVGYRPHAFKPSFGELFILENSSFALYFDFLWYQDAAPFVPAFSMGLELHTDISLLGIKTLPFTVYCGWDQTESSYVWGFWFNVTV